MFQVAALVFALYVAWRLIKPLSIKPWIKWLLSALAIAATLHHYTVALFWGTRASPEIPGALIMVLGWAFGAVLLAACFTLIADLAGLLMRVLYRPAGLVLLRSPALRGVLGLAAISLSALGVWQAVKVPAVKSIEVQLKGLPASLDGFKLVQLTDLHASRLLQGPWIQAIVDKTQALNPDLIVITGDLVDGTVSARRDDVAPLQSLSAPNGVYVIAGNHEYYTQYQPWIEHFKSLGLELLLNEHSIIQQGDAAFALAGITDKSAAAHGQPLPDVRAAIAGIPEGMPIIMLAHRPDTASASATAGAALQLSGHTHGGHIVGMHKIVQMANDGYVGGLYQVGDMQLYVSYGAGLWAGFPLRLGRASEITQITLRAPKAHP
ncbi:metallophosphoesterase [Alcaligenes pakistanensis]|uniref:Metallophosphoesterase n=1 Tax=Alcaligenes pakistanensis TaxID=1482717 RepID=A0A8H9ILC1_9BURK|nr:metallophosphoesterase [Alcaligenes pakistanensis]GHC38544.1 metallophosphoesterase [Alcaligenes pakistanensis]